MDSAAYLAHLRRDLTAFEEFLAADLDVRIRHCGDWTLHDLAEHLGRSGLWSAAAVTERRGDHEAGPAPRERRELVTWFAGASATLLEALDRDSAAPAWTFRPPHTVGFWQRRRCHEAIVHRWDAEHALGLAHSVDPAFADDGVSEVFEVMAFRQIDRGRARFPARAIRLDATDTGSSWTYGPGTPAAAISGTAEHLLLLLWNRLASDDPAIRWEGDRDAGQAVLDGPLVS
ncbi:maleylpyruvate isomerase family mycothiol-dependent enzyme [Actinomadura sp. DC4]|uniref:maleylpyruvate isomerase family mycothiol-dependent enzyme n=1 Tax=Actinomadura sp. DC4 TaxID=3055069 RepID=UPI0025B02D13|nr:maleylpyruvate isomerase family mycothiol-dependent enzyme [Actinomadura sp. DC4]MDN3355909.1 maleylpyruvate isomerase family mycothiol-dependent enzyme [Actinomadura sp. DC4]